MSLLIAGIAAPNTGIQPAFNTQFLNEKALIAREAPFLHSK